MRSTFRILFYINRNKAKKNGKAAVLCRITVDGRSARYGRGVRTRGVADEVG